jgi:hypothetical protein
MTDYCLYLDAAGHSSDKPHIVVDGFIASENSWLEFHPDRGPLIEESL